ncbi:MAG: hypothetical protein ACR2JG_14095 [Geodermatophilaceae bacterium]
MSHRRAGRDHHPFPFPVLGIDSDNADLNPAQLRRDILTLGDQLLDLVKGQTPTGRAPGPPAVARPASLVTTPTAGRRR